MGFPSRLMRYIHNVRQEWWWFLKEGSTRKEPGVELAFYSVFYKFLLVIVLIYYK